MIMIPSLIIVAHVQAKPSKIPFYILLSGPPLGGGTMGPVLFGTRQGFKILLFHYQTDITSVEDWPTANSVRPFLRNMHKIIFSTKRARLNTIDHFLLTIIKVSNIHISN